MTSTFTCVERCDPFCQIMQVLLCMKHLAVVRINESEVVLVAVTSLLCSWWKCAAMVKFLNLLQFRPCSFATFKS